MFGASLAMIAGIIIGFCTVGGGIFYLTRKGF